MFRLTLLSLVVAAASVSAIQGTSNSPCAIYQLSGPMAGRWLTTGIWSRTRQTVLQWTSDSSAARFWYLDDLSYLRIHRNSPNEIDLATAQDGNAAVTMSSRGIALACSTSGPNNQLICHSANGGPNNMFLGDNGTYPSSHANFLNFGQGSDQQWIAGSQWGNTDVELAWGCDLL